MRNCRCEPYILRAASLAKFIVLQEVGIRIFLEKPWRNLDHVFIEARFSDCLSMICNHLYNGSETCTLTPFDAGDHCEQRIVKATE
jgi:hypothetical protein